MSHWSSWLYPVIIFLTPLLTSASTRSERYQLVDCCVSGTRTSRKRTPFAHLDIWPSILRAPPNAVLDQGLTEVSFASRERGSEGARSLPVPTSFFSSAPKVVHRTTDTTQSPNPKPIDQLPHQRHTLILKTQRFEGLRPLHIQGLCQECAKSRR